MGLIRVGTGWQSSRFPVPVSAGGKCVALVKLPTNYGQIEEMVSTYQRDLKDTQPENFRD